MRNAVIDQTGRRIKVIHFIWWIPHYRVPIFRRLSQNTNFNFEVCAGDNTDIGRGAKVASASEVGKIEGVNWRRLESRRIKSRPFKDFEWLPEAVKIAWKEDIDVVISLGYQSFSNTLIRVICKIRGIPLIEWTQGVKREEKGFRWLIRKLYFKWARAFLIYGEFARDFFASHGFKKEQLFVVRNSLDYDTQKELREKISPDQIKKCRAEFGAASEDSRLIFNSGRLERGKKLDLLIKAVAMLKKIGRNVHLVLIGDGREKEALQNLCREHHIEDCVLFYGACYDEDALSLIISASDMCVVPGEVGLVAMHSLVYGTPLLTCENTRGMHGPEIEAIKEGKTGGYFKDNDLDDLVTKMEEMLYPISCKKKMSDNCKEIIDNYYTPEYQERIVVQALNYCLPPEKRIPVPN